MASSINYFREAKLKEEEEDYLSAILLYLKHTEELIKSKDLSDINFLDIIERNNFSVKRLVLLCKSNSDSDSASCSDVSQEDMQQQSKVEKIPSHKGKGDEVAYKIKEELKELLLVDYAKVKWNQVIGLDLAKKAVREAVLIPKYLPGSGQAKNPWKGILLFGPTGVGKTFLARAIASEAGCTFINVKAECIFSKWVGNTEKAISAIFEIARENSPSILFIDEVDSFCLEREGKDNTASKTCLLTQMEGLETSSCQVIVIGATNLPQSMDGGFRRRFQKRILVSLPDMPERKLILEGLINKYHNDMDEKDIVKIAKLTDGYSGADLESLTMAASNIPAIDAIPVEDLENNGQTYTNRLSPVIMKHFMAVIENVKPTNNDKMMRKVEQFNEDFGYAKSSENNSHAKSHLSSVAGKWIYRGVKCIGLDRA